MQTIADRINERMKGLGIKQADIMRATNAGRATISSWVNGSTEPSAKYLPKLAEVLKCNSDWLVGGQVVQNQVNNQHGYIGGSVSQSVINNYTKQPVSNDDWFFVADNAMSPTFDIGDHVHIDTKKDVAAGNYVLVECNGLQTLRKYRPKGYDENGKPYTHLVAENEDYPIIDDRYQAFTIIGVAVEFKRKLV